MLSTSNHRVNTCIVIEVCFFLHGSKLKWWNQEWTECSCEQERFYCYQISQALTLHYWFISHHGDCPLLPLIGHLGSSSVGPTFRCYFTHFCTCSPLTSNDSPLYPLHFISNNPLIQIFLVNCLKMSNYYMIFYAFLKSGWAVPLCQFLAGEKTYLDTSNVNYLSFHIFLIFITYASENSSLILMAKP